MKPIFNIKPAEASLEGRGRMDLFILDVDGVMTDGSFVYDSTGKVQKRFGPEDGDALRLLRDHMHIEFVSADHRGFAISEARIARDLDFPLSFVPANTRIEWLQDKAPLATIAYMGDSFLDAAIFRAVGYAICPANAHPLAKSQSDFVTHASGANGAVAEACFHLDSELGFNIPEFGPPKQERQAKDMA